MHSKVVRLQLLFHIKTNSVLWKRKLQDYFLYMFCFSVTRSRTISDVQSNILNISRDSLLSIASQFLAYTSKLDSATTASNKRCPLDLPSLTVNPQYIIVHTQIQYFWSVFNITSLFTSPSFPPLSHTLTVCSFYCWQDNEARNEAKLFSHVN